MKHLTPAQLVDLIEGVLPAERAAHVGACARCRQQADELRAVMCEAREVDVPEPSPLFWDHLSQRVRDACEAEPEVGSSGWVPSGSLSRLALAVTTVTVVVAVIVGGVLVRSPTEEAAPGGDSVAALLAYLGLGLDGLDAEPDLFESFGEEPAWTLVMTVAQEIDWDDTGAAELVGPGASERAVLELSPDERRELGRLLEAELAGEGG
jgi:hypothetical protein